MAALLKTIKTGTVIGMLALSPSLSMAQNSSPPPTQPEAGASQDAPQQQAPTIGAQELEQLAAPIALYPDSLLTQVLMASTYPLEIVEAARWSQTNTEVKGAELEAAMGKQNWDPSVKSLTAFPQILQMMSEKLDWTEKLGDAFLAQQKDMMDAVQRLRAKAEAQGALKSNDRQTVRVDGAPPQQIIVIEPAQPDVVYVPTYNPTVVYGPWPYPSYPPYSYYPPGYVAGAEILSFGLGIAAGYALWGDYDWHDDNVNVNVNNYTRFNRAAPPPGWHGGGQQWRHDPQHRRGVPYHNPNVERQFRGNNAFSDRNQAREQARDASRGRADGNRPGAGGSGEAFRPDGNRPGAGGRGEALRPDGNRLGADGAGVRHPVGQGVRQGGQGGAFHGVDRGQRAVADGNRGASSRQIMQNHPTGGGNRGGGGGIRRR